MAIKTSLFSGWQLSGEDAKNFLEKSERHTINHEIKDFIKKGKKLSDEYLEKGYVTIDPHSDNKQY